jgi:hypothetical protein
MGAYFLALSINQILYIKEKLKSEDKLRKNILKNTKSN